MLIPDPKFYLKDKNSSAPTLIYMQAKYSYNGHQRVMISCGDKICPNQWNELKQRAIVSNKDLNSNDLNLWLDKMANTFKMIFRNYIIDGIIPTSSMIKERMEEKLNLNTSPPSKVEKILPITLYSFIENFIEQNKALKTIATVKAYRSTFNKIKEYGDYCNKVFSFEEITLEWRAGFLKFVQALGVGKNTEGKYIKNLKTFLNEATERGENNNLAFKSRSFSKPSEDVVKIFLTKQEIQTIAQLDLKCDKQKEITRDYFLIACSTSLRYSDFTQIRREHIKDNFLQMQTAKTGKSVIIPLASIVQKVLEKYNYDLPKAPCNQIFNRQLKEIGKLAGLNEKIHTTKTIGGIKQTFIQEKWELLSSHVGRRSLISNAILEGINTSSIMLISGHSSLKTFQTYVRINEKQNAEVLAKLPLFSN